MLPKRHLSGLLLSATLCTFVACGESEPVGTGEGDNRPPGTFLVRFLFSHFCDLSPDATGYLYDDLPSIGGKLLDSQKVKDSRLDFYLPPQTRYALVVMDLGEEIYPEELFWSSNRDVQKDSTVCQ